MLACSDNTRSSRRAWRRGEEVKAMQRVEGKIQLTIKESNQLPLRNKLLLIPNTHLVPPLALTPLEGATPPPRDSSHRHRSLKHGSALCDSARWLCELLERSLTVAWRRVSWRRVSWGRVSWRRVSSRWRALSASASYASSTDTRCWRSRDSCNWGDRIGEQS